MEIIEKIKKHLNEFADQRKALVEELQKDYPLILKPFFDQHPKILKISWNQYTPYWQDGDTCEFKVHSDYDSLSINGVDYYDEEGDHEEGDHEDDYKELSEILKSVPEEFYKDLFGDHSEITIHRDLTVEVDEYDYD